MRILFSNKKVFNIDGVYNVQNDHAWAPSRVEADECGGIKMKRRFPQKVMVWLGACSKGITSLAIFENGTIDHNRYIRKVRPVTFKYRNKIFGDYTL